jgi:hypothetical protein
MSRHAQEQWEKRVGGKPPWDATPLLNECVFIQQHRDLYTSRGKPYKVLALYWHPDKGIILKVDEKNALVVTVLTKKTLSKDQLKNVNIACIL